VTSSMPSFCLSVILSVAKNLKLGNRGPGPYFLSLDGRGLR